MILGQLRIGARQAKMHPCCRHTNNILSTYCQLVASILAILLVAHHMSPKYIISFVNTFSTTLITKNLHFLMTSPRLGEVKIFCYPRAAQLTFLRKMKIFRCPRGPKWPYWGSEDFSIPTGTHECTFCLRKIIIKRPFWPRISTVCGEILAQSRSPRSLLFMEKKCVLSSGGCP